MLKGTVSALAAALGLALLAGPAIGQTYDSIELQVPVKLKNMHPDAKFAVIDCEIWGKEVMLGRGGHISTIQQGELDEVVLIHILSKSDTFVDAKAAVCSLFLSRSNDPHDSKTFKYQVAIKGTPPSADIWRLGKPDEYFMQTFRYPLDGYKFVPGISGSTDLTIQPKQKE